MESKNGKGIEHFGVGSLRGAGVRAVGKQLLGVLLLPFVLGLKLRELDSLGN